MELNDYPEKKRKTSWEVLKHRPYSPDVSPLDFNLFEHLKKFLAEKYFAVQEESQDTIANYFKQLDKQQYRKGMFKLVSPEINVLKFTKIISGVVTRAHECHLMAICSRLLYYTLTLSQMAASCCVFVLFSSCAECVVCLSSIFTSINFMWFTNWSKLLPTSPLLIDKRAK
ncbi:hypothetical protein AVEN_217597-1 [Araneus ventricosus]|uniref:Histone-lysine N-methyltransferase SETMAR n=1 Tax=Araneus ventricosus TaxID=182803 RepID=A0A4Y2FHZ6_ARAVE|nr:hypothetical protein AVEN_217597-1 [Araneus ventricosus]